MKKLIAYCGLDCEKCDARIATINNDDNLRRETSRKCAMAKGYQTCGDCKELDKCSKVAMVISNNGEARKNLKG